MWPGFSKAEGASPIRARPSQGMMMNSSEAKRAFMQRRVEGLRRNLDELEEVQRRRERRRERFKRVWWSAIIAAWASAFTFVMVGLWIGDGRWTGTGLIVGFVAMIVALWKSDR